MLKELFKGTLASQQVLQDACIHGMGIKGFAALCCTKPACFVLPGNGHSRLQSLLLGVLDMRIQVAGCVALEFPLHAEG